MTDQWDEGYILPTRMVDFCGKLVGIYNSRRSYRISSNTFGSEFHEININTFRHFAGFHYHTLWKKSFTTDPSTSQLAPLSPGCVVPGASKAPSASVDLHLSSSQNWYSTREGFYRYAGNTLVWSYKIQSVVFSDTKQRQLKKHDLNKLNNLGFPEIIHINLSKGLKTLHPVRNIQPEILTIPEKIQLKNIVGN